MVFAFFRNMTGSGLPIGGPATGRSSSTRADGKLAIWVLAELCDEEGVSREKGDTQRVGGRLNHQRFNT